MKKVIILLFLFVLKQGLVYGQDDKDPWADMLIDDQEAIEALVLYPDSIRRLIFEVAAQPDALVRIENIREKMQEKFKLRISSFKKEIQTHFYEIARYPGLLEELVSGGKKSKAEIKSILETYPENIHEASLKVGRKHYEELVAILSLIEITEEAFGLLKKSYSPEFQANLDRLIKLPEVLDILMENFRSTILIGAAYKRNPEKIWHFADSLQKEVATRHSKELLEWKESLNNDLDALGELEAAAEEFAKENGYDPKSYRSGLLEEELYLRGEWHHSPYSYWFGYPWWYPYPMWYARPYWYYWGFYYDLNHQIIVFSFPSWYYINWYFSRDYHHYYYPHLSNRYLSHYERHRNSSMAASSRIRDWMDQNRNSYSRDWLRNDVRRPERLREYGALDNAIRKRPSPSYQRPTYTRPNRPTIPQSYKIEGKTILNRATEYHRQNQRSTINRSVRKADLNERNRKIPKIQNKPVKRRNRPN